MYVVVGLGIGHPQLEWNIYMYVYCGGAWTGPSPASMEYIYTYICMYIVMGLGMGHTQLTVIVSIVCPPPELLQPLSLSAFASPSPTIQYKVTHTKENCGNLGYCLLPIVYLPIACCLLPIAYCLSPIACCPLHTAYFILPIAFAYSHVPIRNIA